MRPSVMRSLLDAQQVHGVQVARGCGSSSWNDGHRPALNGRGAEGSPGPPAPPRRPSAVKARTLDLATLECRTSPMMAIRIPSRDPRLFPQRVAVQERLSRMFVAAVSGVDHRQVGPVRPPGGRCRPSSGEPPGGRLRTRRSTSTVSRMLSPLLSDEVPALNATVSAERRRAAVSNDMRVRVEFSKKAVATVRPRRAGTFGMGRRPISANVSVRSRISSRSERDMPSIPRRCRPMPPWVGTPRWRSLLHYP